MNTLIFRTAAPFLSALMMLFSIFVLLRGQDFQRHTVYWKTLMLGSSRS